MNNSKQSSEVYRLSRTSSVMSTDLTPFKIDSQLKNISTSQFGRKQSSYEGSDKKLEMPHIQPPQPTRSQANKFFEVYDSANVHSELMDSTKQPQSSSFKYQSAKLKENQDPIIIKKLIESAKKKQQLMESMDYQYQQPPQYQSVYMCSQSDSKPKEFSIADSISLFRSIDEKHARTPNFSSGHETQFQAPSKNEQEQLDEFEDENTRTLFSFLHCFPPSTMLKIIPTQYAVRNLSESDCGKLAIVPTEVLIDLNESRYSLQELVDSQKQIIRLLLEGSQQKLLEQALRASQQIEVNNKSKEKNIRSEQNCMIF